MLIALGVVFFLFSLVYAPGALAGWISCGQWLTPPDALAPLKVITPAHLGDTSGFGVSATGCTASPSLAMVLAVVIIVAEVTLALVIVQLVRNWQESDQKFLKDLYTRRGIAQAREVEKKYGPKATLRKIPTLRPTLSAAVVTDAAFLIGHVGSKEVYVTCEDSITLLGAPRSGKGVHFLIGAIIDAPGSCVTTSTRVDNYAATHQLRALKGPVILFDPQGLTGLESSLKWSPILGCEKPLIAARRASGLIGGSALGQSSNNQEWAEAAVENLRALLHAAALGKCNTDDLFRWGIAPSSAMEAVKILEEHPAGVKEWGMGLRAVLEGDAKQLANQWFGVKLALGGLAVPEVRHWLNPASPEEQLNPREFITSCATLYLIGTKTGGTAVGPFITALLDELTETAREMAIRMPGNRLDPPMTMILDEIANITRAWPGLVNLMADGGGTGISLWVVLQSLAQARGGWGQDEAQAVFDSSTVKLQLGGGANVSDLDDISRLADERSVREISYSHGVEAMTSSVQKRDKAVLSVADLRRLPFGTGLMLARTGRPVLMRLTKWTERPDADQIRASIKAISEELLAQMEADVANDDTVFRAEDPSEPPIRVL
ncbi:type IV secretory system conjugative DNA transfer family protein [Arthrobacter woluwensis]|nr:TraM recognition domain-containing protein [Arthrobacter woluwensis]